MKMKMLSKLLSIVLTALLILCSCNSDRHISLLSPDKNIKLSITDSNHQIYFALLLNNDTLISSSPIGLEVSSHSRPSRIVNISETETDETWQAINGKNSIVRNRYNEYLIKLGSDNEDGTGYDIIFRCYNDGFAYRYNFDSEQNTDSINITGEKTQIRFKHDFTWWSYNGENQNLGPLQRSESLGRSIRIPMVLKFSETRYMAIHEAGILRFAPLSLFAGHEDYSLDIRVEEAVAESPFHTSWRTFIIGSQAGDLLESDLLVNLNEPCKIEDASWIKPGKSMWDWRVWGYKADDGFEYGLNTISHKRLIDFASENNIQYLLIDADWYGSEFSETSDPTSSREGIDIVECMRYAREKKVGIILYLNDVGARKFGLERVLQQFADWGAVGVKYGFMRGTAEQKVIHTRKVIKLCAKYHLMVDFHDNPVPPSGDRRTWPNLMTKEFCHSQADAKKSYFPETAVTSPFVNMIAGPLDKCDGWFDLNNAQSRVKVFKQIPGTVAAEVAKLIVNYTGWTILPDSPEEYLKKDDLFDCIRKMPPMFDSFKVLDGQIGEYISVARGAGSDWFIGSLTNREAKSIDIDFSFLPDSENYQATFYEDTGNTHFQKNKESYQIRRQVVNSSTRLTIRMAPGGGNAIYLLHGI